MSGRWTAHPRLRDLLPSQIYYLQEPRDFTQVQTRLAEIDLIRYSRRLISRSNHPRLQAVFHLGHWFALDSLHLAICRHLERTGLCSRIIVGVCDVTLLPPGIRKLMVPPVSISNLICTSDFEITSVNSQSDSENEDVDNKLEINQSDVGNQDAGSTNGNESDNSCASSYCSLCDNGNSLCSE